MSFKEIEQWIEEALQEQEQVIELTQVINPELDQAIKFEEDTMKLSLRSIKFATSNSTKELHKRAYKFASMRKQELLMSYRKVE